MEVKRLPTTDGVEDSDLKKEESIVDGTTHLYENGHLRLIPAPSSHPDGMFDYLPSFPKALPCSLSVFLTLQANISLLNTRSS
jgi:hypothetical protein